MTSQDKKLIKKIKKGNQRAFKQLYEIHSNYALRTAYAITRNQSDASDIVQETFIRVYRNIDSFDVSKPFKPWFYQILINESKRYLKKMSQVEMNVEFEHVLDYLFYFSNEGDMSIREDIEWGIEQLDEIHRLVITLKYLNGFSVKEIAEMLEVNVNTIKSRLFKGRKQLKLILGGTNNE
ncbi:RNA polymerase sigma factor [Ornithinibacillus halophilus]|uniref:RNA polymerase sigma-70 factor, ECF subfamily n=1 Tax=Ornithinibacillus halophilus TaxID=930117 RepID=A0A1M5GC49_9BACI|nr:RNA polymerase sigma factor [Ornithinibacillus halophilus]SHG01269.1 RNA polymerase sigma-70 factor, ECF subfamily [Ornithinibacillus halophilus]